MKYLEDLMADSLDATQRITRAIDNGNVILCPRCDRWGWSQDEFTLDKDVEYCDECMVILFPLLKDVKDG